MASRKLHLCQLPDTRPLGVRTPQLRESRLRSRSQLGAGQRQSTFIVFVSPGINGTVRLRFHHGSIVSARRHNTVSNPVGQVYRI